ncbi:MAG: response regulator transcription factor [Verrucomicrobia bacterium]|nr:response regulator transcription factor [Verrucomicrobiota bacterium]
MIHSKYKIVIVDDEEDVTSLLRYHLEAESFIVETINDPTQIMGVARDFEPDLFILDIMMPDINGLQICRMIRADQRIKHVPVIFLTAKTEDKDRIHGLESGGDDYICKPFNIKEVVLRVKAILKRTRQSSPNVNTSRVQIRKVMLDEDQHLLQVEGNNVELTATEFKLLKLLIERKGRVQSRESLLTNVWQYESDTETRTVDTHVRRLREKLGNQADIIETIRGVGYRVVEA